MTPPPNKPGGRNRRSWSRMPAASFPNVKASLASGLDVELINVSRGGAQFRTANRLLPGLSVSLRLITADGQLVMKGKVVRSSMVKLANGALGYEVGVAFDLELGTPIKTPAQERAERQTTSGAAETEVVEPAGVPDLDLSIEDAAEPSRLGLDVNPDQLEVLDPKTARTVNVNADVPGESLDGLIDLLK